MDPDGKFDTLKEYNNLSDEDDNSPNYGAAIACYFLGSLICLGTFAEDFATVGIGVADDPESLAVAGMLFAYGRMLTRGDIPVYSKATNKSNRNIGVLQNSLFGGGNNACASPSPMFDPDDDDQQVNKQSAKDAKKLDDKSAKQFSQDKGYSDVHALKKDILRGQKDTTVGHYDIYRNYKTGESFLINKSGNIIIPIE